MAAAELYGGGFTHVGTDTGYTMGGPPPCSTVIRRTPAARAGSRIRGPLSSGAK